MTLEGVCPVIATPFDESDAVDYESLETQARALIDGGCHGLVLFGFASEFYKLTDEEKRKMINVVASECDGTETQLFVSITQHASAVAEDWARRAENAGADGLMLLPPFLMGPSESDLYDHIARVGRAVSIPILVQYAPENTGTTIDPDVFARLSAEVPNVDHYKIESAPPGTYISSLLDKTDDDVNVLVGSAGRQMIEAYDRGAIGVIPGGALHEVYLKIHDRYTNGDRQKALELHSELLPLLNQIGQGSEMFIHYEKQMLSRRGFIENPYCRDPSFDPDPHFDRLVDEYFESLRHHLTM